MSPPCRGPRPRRRRSRRPRASRDRRRTHLRWSPRLTGRSPQLAGTPSVPTSPAAKLAAPCAPHAVQFTSSPSLRPAPSTAQTSSSDRGGQKTSDQPGQKRSVRRGRLQAGSPSSSRSSETTSRGPRRIKTRLLPRVGSGVDALNIDDRCAQILGSYRAIPRGRDPSIERREPPRGRRGVRSWVRVYDPTNREQQSPLRCGGGGHGAQGRRARRRAG